MYAWIYVPCSESEESDDESNREEGMGNVKGADCICLDEEQLLL